MGPEMLVRRAGSELGRYCVKGTRASREEGCRREEAIRSFLKRRCDRRLTIGDVEAVAWELGVSRSTMYLSHQMGSASFSVTDLIGRSANFNFTVWKRNQDGLPG